MVIEIDHSLVEMTNAITVDNMVTGNLNADLAVEEAEAAIDAAAETSIDVMVASEAEITEDHTTETEETVVDSVEETDLDLVLQEDSEVHQDDNTMMTSEEDQTEERDPDLVAEMDHHTVENGIVMRTDILSEEA